MNKRIRLVDEVFLAKNFEHSHSIRILKSSSNQFDKVIIDNLWVNLIGLQLMLTVNSSYARHRGSVTRIQVISFNEEISIQTIKTEGKIDLECRILWHFGNSTVKIIQNTIKWISNQTRLPSYTFGKERPLIKHNLSEQIWLRLDHLVKFSKNNQYATSP